MPNPNDPHNGSVWPPPGANVPQVEGHTAPAGPARTLDKVEFGPPPAQPAPQIPPVAIGPLAPDVAQGIAMSLVQTKKMDPRQANAFVAGLAELKVQPAQVVPGIGQNGEVILQATFILPPNIPRQSASAALLGPDGQPVGAAQMIQALLFHGPLGTVIVRKDGLSDEARKMIGLGPLV